MKIISWNCCGKFREKYKLIENIDADIYVIQECENPKTTKKEEYKRFASNFIWIGLNTNKGLGIFAKESIKIDFNNWDTYCLRHFLSVKVNDKFDLLGVWAGNPYIEEYYIYHCINKERYNKNTVIIGDFNSNKKWDYKHKGRNHSMVVNSLSEIGLSSAYHFINNEAQGEECDNTFFLYRNKEKAYHIDYVFLNSENIKDFKILLEDNWLEVYDHKPIFLETYD